jgi:hypothetical protein
MELVYAQHLFVKGLWTPLKAWKTRAVRVEHRPLPTALRPPQTSGGTVIEEIVKETRSALRDVLRTARSRLV